MPRTTAKLAILLAAGCVLIAVMSATRQESKMLRHVVLLKFKEGTTAEQINLVETAFRKLPSQIKTIKSFEWGLNNSPEKLNEGLTHCFFVSFISEKDRDDYLVDPAHKAFVALLTPYLDKPVVVDYWAMN